jgi:hydroxymethylglutaryl-CoA lyase
MNIVKRIFELADEYNIKLKELSFADTMAWATPLQIKRLIGTVPRKVPPDMALNLHLHDTRGMGVANAYAGSKWVSRCSMRVSQASAAVRSRRTRVQPGNVCTEDLVFMCQEMGIETGIDLDKMIECAQLAEDIVGHPLPGSVKLGGNLDKLRGSPRLPIEAANSMSNATKQARELPLAGFAYSSSATP